MRERVSNKGGGETEGENKGMWPGKEKCTIATAGTEPERSWSKTHYDCHYTGNANGMPMEWHGNLGPTS